MNMRFFAVLIIFAAAWRCGVAESQARWPMRDRVYCNYDAGISFRYPYEYECPDQYEGGLRRERRGSYTLKITGEVSKERLAAAQHEINLMNKQVDVLAFSATASELPSDAIELAQIGDHFASDQRLQRKPGLKTFSWAMFDYYQRLGARLHATPSWAPPKIEALTGESDDACALIVKHGERYSGLIMTGKLDDFANRAIIDSFEIMVGKGKAAESWRDSLAKKGMVIGPDGKPVKADGKPVKADGKKPSPWSAGWECDTRHYHVTTQVSTARLLDYAQFLEAIYRAYAAMYKPESVPPYKMEVHVFIDQHAFQEAAQEHGFATNPNMGGFFVPDLLAIYAFQNMPPMFSEEFTLERVLAHECSHQFLHCTCNGSSHVPTWLNEGLAVYFESGTFSNGNFSLRPPTGRVNLLKELYEGKRGTLRPLDAYLKHYGPISPEEYGEVYAMTHYWIFGAKGGNVRFREYWQALKKAENGSDAFERIFMADLIKAHGGRDQAVAVWEKALVEYVIRTLK
jgi:hypothetical protein